MTRNTLDKSCKEILKIKVWTKYQTNAKEKTNNGW